MKLPPRVSTRRYNYWTAHGLVWDKPELSSPGSGYHRKITPYIWDKLAIMGALADLGLPGAECSRIAREILDAPGTAPIIIGTAIPEIALVIDQQALTPKEEHDAATA